MSLRCQRQLAYQGPSWVAKCLQGMGVRYEVATHLHLDSQMSSMANTLWLWWVTTISVFFTLHVVAYWHGDQKDLYAIKRGKKKKEKF